MADAPTIPPVEAPPPDTRFDSDEIEKGVKNDHSHVEDASLQNVSEEEEEVQNKLTKETILAYLVSSYLPPPLFGLLDILFTKYVL